MEKLTQLFEDIVKLWGAYGGWSGQYMVGIRRTLLLAVAATLIGCLIGLLCGILNTIPYSKSDNIVKRYR